MTSLNRMLKNALAGLFLKLETYMDDQLGKDYEEWLDEVEKTLPLPIPEEEQMSRTQILQQIYARLARLEEDREVARLADQDVSAIDSEMKSLRIKLQDVMNSPCPLLKEGGK